MLELIIMDKKELVKALGGKLTDYTVGELTRRGTMGGVIKLPGMRRYLYNYEAVVEWLTGLQKTQTGERTLKVVGR
jgi:hypothetical protein